MGGDGRLGGELKVLTQKLYVAKRRQVECGTAFQESRYLYLIINEGPHSCCELH